MAFTRFSRHAKLRFFFLLLALLAPAPLLALGTSESSAFLFAEKKNWKEAYAHARQSGDKVLISLIQWQALLDPDSRMSFEDATAFIRAHPTWPSQNRLKVRAEMALRDQAADDAVINAWFAKEPPVTGIGKMKYAESLLRGGASLKDEKISYLLRDAWRNGDFSEDGEQRMLTTYGAVLHEQDHVIRADRLLWDEKTDAALRMLPVLEPSVRAVVKARAALITDASDAASLTSQVPQALARDPGLLHSRLTYAAKQENDGRMREILLAAGSNVPYPEKWWKLRELQVRKAIDEKDYSLAKRLLANHAQVDGQEAADARWLSGWLALRFDRDGGSALTAFRAMHDDVKFPVSRARAAYWAARAAEAQGDRQEANNWYRKAAAYPSVFYGQLANAKLGQTLSLPSEKLVDAAILRNFNAQETVRAARLALRHGADGTATTFINHLIDNAKNAGEAQLAAKLGADMKSPVLAVRGAKRALQRDFLLLSTGYPVPRLPSGLDIEPALALAIVRQESEFDPAARSRAGAVGMMQLLPGTAKEVAGKLGTRYVPAKLTDPSYNITLGSAYLGRLVRAYEGSYVQAIAGYNAGPSRVRQWSGQFGEPGDTVEEAVDWIEKIPYAETRNYVQRVLENLQIYRHLREPTGKLRLAEDLTRKL